MGRDRDWVRGRRSVLAACATAAALALGACGGGDEEAATTESDTESDEAAVEQVVADFGAAEGSDACDFTSQAYLDSLGGTAGCDKEFAEAVAVDYAISDVQVDGEQATATADTDDQTVAFELVLVDGEWKISSTGPPDDGGTTEADPPIVSRQAVNAAQDITNGCLRLVGFDEATQSLVQSGLPRSFSNQLSKQLVDALAGPIEDCLRDEVASYAGPGDLIVRTSPGNIPVADARVER